MLIIQSFLLISGSLQSILYQRTADIHSDRILYCPPGQPHNELCVYNVGVNLTASKHDVRVEKLLSLNTHLIFVLFKQQTQQMRKHRKSDSSEIEDKIVVMENADDDEAATERFINRLELQRKLLINFIEPATGKSGKIPEKGNIKPDRKSRK